MQGNFFPKQQSFTQRNREQIINSAINPKFQSASFSDEEFTDFNLPPNWSCFRLGEVIKVKSGKYLPNSKMIEGPIPVYGGNGLNGFHNEYFIEENSLIIGRVGAQCGNVHITEQKAWVTDNALIVDFPKDYIDIKFLAYLLEFLELGKHSSSTAQPVISGRKIYPLPIAIPLLEEQVLIVKKIEDIFSKIDFYQSLYISAERTRNEFPNRLEKSILQYAIEGKLVEQDTSDEPASELLKRISEQKEQMIKEKVIKKEKSLPPITEEEIPFDIPDTWEWVRIKDVYYNDGQIKPDQTFYYVDVSAIDNKKGEISKDIKLTSKESAPSRARKIASYGDILYSTVRPYLKNIAIVDVKKDMPLIASTAFVVMRPIEIYNEYLYYVLKSPYFDNEVKNRVQGVTYPAINDTNFNSLLVPIPPLNEQHRIVSKIKNILLYIDDLISF